MKSLLTLILLIVAASGAAAQAPAAGPVAQALRRSFPQDHAALVHSLAGQPPEAARRLLHEAMERFHHQHLAAILAAPGPRLLAIEARHGAMLRALGRRDTRLCAVVGDRGFFSRQARAAAPAPGLDDYAVALIEAAAAGHGQAAPAAATSADFAAWLAQVERREPDVPVRAMLSDAELRARSSPEHLCAGAAAMHEAIADLPPDVAARVAARLAQSTLSAAQTAN